MSRESLYPVRVHVSMLNRIISLALWMEEKLSYYNFMRVHASYFVNILNSG